MGAGLLAKAVCQSTSAVADPAYSRASPLPHFDIACVCQAYESTSAFINAFRQQFDATPGEFFRCP